MDDAKKYRVDTARDDITDLDRLLQYIATLGGHVRIVSVTWQPSRPSKGGSTHRAGYTIISEMDV